MQKEEYVRLYSDAQGESHFEQVSVSLLPVDFAPPAPPLNVANLFTAARCGLLSGQPYWGGEIPHPAPQRQLFCTVRGEYEVTASDGDVQRFPVGSLLLLEDTSGAGHSTRILDDCLVLSVTL